MTRPTAPSSTTTARTSRTSSRLDALHRVEEMAALPDHHVIGLDFSGDRAQAIISQGDLDTASHAGVFTPGFTSTVDGMGGYDADMGAIREASAQSVLQQMTAEQIEAAGGYQAALQAARDDVATVTWLDYQAPQWDTLVGGNSVASSGAAEEGGADLADFFHGIDAARGEEVDVTAMGHSYGSTTTGYAVQEEGTGVDRAVFFGSPGLGVDDVSDLHVPEGQVYYQEAAWDPVGDFGVFGNDPSVIDGITQLETGASTAADGTPLQGSSGHSEYLTGGTTSAYNLAQLMSTPTGSSRARTSGPRTGSTGCSSDPDAMAAGPRRRAGGDAAPRQRLRHRRRRRQRRGRHIRYRSRPRGRGAALAPGVAWDTATPSRGSETLCRAPFDDVDGARSATYATGGGGAIPDEDGPRAVQAVRDVVEPESFGKYAVQEDRPGKHAVSFYGRDGDELLVTGERSTTLTTLGGCFLQDGAAGSEG